MCRSNNKWSGTIRMHNFSSSNQLMLQACLPFTDILKGVQSLSGSIPGSSQASLDQLNQQSYMFEGKDVCYNSGLFALSAEFMGFHFSLPLSRE